MRAVMIRIAAVIAGLGSAAAAAGCGGSYEGVVVTEE